LSFFFLAIVLSILLRFTGSDCPFGIFKLFLGTDHLTCRGGYGCLFRSEFFFRTTRELEYLFFLSRKARIFFFQNLTLGYLITTLNQIFFPPPKSVYFFSNIGNQNIFLEKKHSPPLEVKWSVP
jgi:hypothetical protein